MSEWISVNERLPDEEALYIVVDKWDVGALEFLDGRFHDNDDDLVSASCITHWMPLPLPPK